MRSTMAWIGALALAGVLIFLWRSAGPEDAGAAHGPPPGSGRAKLLSSSATEEPAWPRPPRADAGTADEAPSAPTDPIAASDARPAWTFHWRLLDQDGEPIDPVRLHENGLSYHELVLRYAGVGGKVHTELPIGLQPDALFEGELSIADGEPPAWIEFTVGGREARAERVMPNEEVALILALPDSSELGRAHFSGLAPDGAPLAIQRVVAEDVSTSRLYALLPQEVEAPEGERALDWILVAPPGSYRCTATADPDLQGVDPRYARAHARFDLTAGREIEVELAFATARRLRGTVTPVPGAGTQSSVRHLGLGTAATFMATRPAAIGADGSFELSGLPPGELELVVLTADPLSAEARMQLFPIAAGEDQVRLTLDPARVPAAYRLAGDDASIWLRVEDARGVVLYQGATPTGLLLHLPGGEHRLFVAPMLQSDSSSGPGLGALIEAGVGAADEDGLREVSFELPE